MATRRQRDRKLRQRRWESLRSHNRARGRWTFDETVYVRDEVRIMVSPDVPAYIPHESGIGGYRVSLVERGKS